MRIVRSVIWVVVLAALLVFSMTNWTTVDVKIWEGLVLQTKLPALVVLSFALGLVPMWIIARASRWRMQRRIVALENAAQAASITLSSTQLDEAAASPAHTDQ